MRFATCNKPDFPITGAVRDIGIRARCDLYSLNHLEAFFEARISNENSHPHEILLRCSTSTSSRRGSLGSSIMIEINLNRNCDVQEWPGCQRWMTALALDGLYPSIVYLDSASTKASATQKSSSHSAYSSRSWNHGLCFSRKTGTPVLNHRNQNHRGSIVGFHILRDRTREGSLGWEPQSTRDDQGPRRAW